MSPTKDPRQIKRPSQTQSRGINNIFCENRKKDGAAILILYKIDFKTKTITTVEDRHFIMIMLSTQQEDITPVNIQAPTIGAPKYIKQILVDTKSKTIMAGDFNTLLMSMDRKSRRKEWPYITH